MNEARPQDLTSEELVLVAAPGVARMESAPLRIPPGTQIAVELLDPGSAEGAAVAPTAGPEEAVGASGRGGHTDTPARQAPRRR